MLVLSSLSILDTRSRVYLMTAGYVRVTSTIIQLTKEMSVSRFSLRFREARFGRYGSVVARDKPIWSPRPWKPGQRGYVHGKGVTSNTCKVAVNTCFVRRGIGILEKGEDGKKE